MYLYIESDHLVSISKVIIIYLYSHLQWLSESSYRIVYNYGIALFLDHVDPKSCAEELY